jgi:glycerophosphoryl diester phosphodiesterase
VRLDQALEIVKPIPEIWIDFKVFSPGFADDVVRTVCRAGIDSSRVMVATFSTNALAYFRDHYPRFRRVGHYSFREVRGDNEQLLSELLAYRDKYGLFGLNLPVKYGQTRPKDVAFLKSKGLWISLWFVQDADKAGEYRSACADAFVTDHVSEVRKALR